jgi:hypothetical protein
MHSRRKRFESTRYTTTMLKLSQWFEARGWHDQPVSKEAALLFATIGDVAPGLIERRWGSLLAWPSRSIAPAGARGIEQHVDDLSRLSSLGAAADAARPISRISAPGSIRLSGPITRCCTNRPSRG